jgi:hypothetical protein
VIKNVVFRFVMFELFGLEEIEILCEVLWNHLRVVNWDENVIIFLILSVK